MSDADELPPDVVKKVIEASPELGKILTRKREDAVEQALIAWMQQRGRDADEWQPYVCVRSDDGKRPISVTLDGVFGVDELRELVRLIDQEFGND